MRARLLTTLCIVGGLALFLAWPWVAGQKPRSRPELVAYSRRMTAYVGGLLACMVGAGVGSVLILRQAKEDYRRASLENMRNLVEGAKEDADRKREA